MTRLARNPLHWGVLGIVVALAACSDQARAPGIEIQRRVSFGDTTGEGALAGGAFISPRLPLGYVTTTPWGEPNLPALFDSSGGFVRLLGRSGEGPGEFRGAQSMLVLGDSLLIVDNQLQRATVFDDSLRLIRHFPMGERPWKLLLLADGSYLASVGIFQRRAPFTHLSRDGAALGRVGVIPEREEMPIHAMARAADGSVWTARMSGRMEFTHYDQALNRNGGFTPVREWFPAAEPFTMPSPSQPPASGVTGIWLDSSDRLWVAGFTADPEWSEGLGPERTGEGGIKYHPVTDARLAYDGIIDVYDSKSGSLLATLRDDDRWVDLAEPGVLVRAAEIGDGWTQLTLWAVRWRQAGP